MKRLVIASILSLAITTVSFAQAPSVVQDISDKDFARLHAQLLPKSATWRSIPWQTSLLKAQNIAAQLNKPIFIWSMDGHPLGCT